jgi:hypothetical protein
LLPQHTGEAGLAGEVDAFVGQQRDDASRRHVGKAWLVGYTQELGALRWAQSVFGRWTYGAGPAIALEEPFLGLPALQSAYIDTDDLARRTEPGSSLVGDTDVLGPSLAIFEADHSSSHLSVLKIDPSFLKVPAVRLPRPAPSPCAAVRV